MERKSYKKTVMACYIGYICQAIVVNFAPIIFMPLREQFGFSFAQLGIIVFINFITQVTVDLAFSRAVDKYGFRVFVIPANIICFLGLAMFALTPFLFPKSVYVGLILSTIIFSAGGGLFELLLSPIIDAIPTDEKERAMAMLHSFYAWGQVGVISITTIGIFFGIPWWIIGLAWAAFPLANTFIFMTAPLERKVAEADSIRIKKLITLPVFLFAFGTIVCGAAAENVMALWSSSFFQGGLGMPKIAGDLLGLCGFVILIGVGRLIYGVKSDKIDIEKVLLYGAAVAVLCYVIVAVSPFNWLSIAACVLCGVCVSMLWPGTLVVASKKLPLAGASMFALLAAGGDMGAAAGPAITGFIADAGALINIDALKLTSEQTGLRLSILAAAAFPLLTVFFVRKLSSVKDVMTDSAKG